MESESDVHTCLTAVFTLPLSPFKIFRYAQDELSAGVTFIKLRDNIAVDHNLVCHTEQSEVSMVISKKTGTV